MFPLRHSIKITTHMLFRMAVVSLFLRIGLWHKHTWTTGKIPNDHECSTECKAGVRVCWAERDFMQMAKMWVTSLILKVGPSNDRKNLGRYQEPWCRWVSCFFQGPSSQHHQQTIYYSVPRHSSVCRNMAGKVFCFLEWVSFSSLAAAHLFAAN